MIQPSSAKPAKRWARVLLVDDEPNLLRYASVVLLEAGYLVDMAADGQEALELVRVRGRRLDAVVSDVVMPHMNGVQLMEALSVSDPDLPVVLMSAYGSTALTDRGIPTPCGMLSKPFPPERLLAEVERCLRPAA
jgi:DNA-binding NtrC family response regulator